ncbi:MAG: phosphoribosylformimino-5-aminoimidazole carboxamide ribotide isomerase [Candidatus Omnitrophota bacterium]|jgi:phosphoribosylformimino-5-aminoimidazole carboxamide ribotide isomerase
MIIFPAIDIKDGKVVRLLQGKFDEVTEYNQDPLVIAKQWKEMGAEWLHIVDLDGAKDGKIQNLDIICKIAREIGIPIEMGGGVRTKEDIAQLIEGGVKRVIFGTKIIQDPKFLVDVLAIWKDKIAVSLDCNNGYLAELGWTNTTNIKATEFVNELELMGLKTIVYTDIARDGMLTGPNFEQLEEICSKTKINIIASGGVANISDIKKLKMMERNGIIGAITGKAIYEGTLDLKEAIEVAHS